MEHASAGTVAPPDGGEKSPPYSRPYLWAAAPGHLALPGSRSVSYLELPRITRSTWNRTIDEDAQLAFAKGGEPAYLQHILGLDAVRQVVAEDPAVRSNVAHVLGVDEDDPVFVPPSLASHPASTGPPPSQPAQNPPPQTQLTPEAQQARDAYQVSELGYATLTARERSEHYRWLTQGTRTEQMLKRILSPIDYRRAVGRSNDLKLVRADYVEALNDYVSELPAADQLQARFLAMDTFEARALEQQLARTMSGHNGGTHETRMDKVGTWVMRTWFRASWAGRGLMVGVPAAVAGGGVGLLAGIGEWPGWAVTAAGIGAVATGHAIARRITQLVNRYHVRLDSYRQQLEAAAEARNHTFLAQHSPLSNPQPGGGSEADFDVTEAYEAGTDVESARPGRRVAFAKGLGSLVALLTVSGAYFGALAVEYLGNTGASHEPTATPVHQTPAATATPKPTATATPPTSSPSPTPHPPNIDTNQYPYIVAQELHPNQPPMQTLQQIIGEWNNAGFEHNYGLILNLVDQHTKLPDGAENIWVMYKGPDGNYVALNPDQQRLFNEFMVDQLTQALKV